MMGHVDKPMSFWDHLAELRTRLVRMLIAFAVGSGVAWFFKERLLLWITAPFSEAWRGGGLEGQVSLHFRAPATLFLTYIKLSILAGAILALPIVLYQLWAFVAPGLYSKEKRLAIPFVISSCTLFGTGAYFCFRVVSPIAFQYLLSFSGSVGGSSFEVKPTVMIDEYLEFVTRFLLAFGVVFELPVLVFFLSIAGLVTHKHLIRFARYFIVIAFIIGAVLTPPDPTSQLLLAVPLCLLYVISIGIAYVFGKRPNAKPAEHAS